MHRNELKTLLSWASRDSRKPLVIRGARQVGKSFLVRMLAEQTFDNCLEINLEVDPSTAALFASKDPTKIVSLLTARYGGELIPGRSLLFIDEIQVAPEVLACLRYFHEKLPGLHVVAAGSLLDFALEDHVFSMPVGRIEYLHLGPMQFGEFLQAVGRTQLQDFLCRYEVGDEIPVALHEELTLRVRQFLVIGGMPASVEAFIQSGEDSQESQALMQNLLATFRDDFAKYTNITQRVRIEKVFTKIPRLIGSKFKYSNVDREERSRDLRQALDALCRARIATRVRHTSANGIPLGAEADDKRFKMLFLDVGLLCRSTGLNHLDIETAEDLLLINSGAVTEQFIGQHLLYSGESYEDPELFCWMRQKSQSNAEVDYVLSIGEAVVPVEVKAGSPGHLRSLHAFLNSKKRSFALRFDTDTPSLLDTVTTSSDGISGPLRLLSLPLYLVEQSRRLCRSCLAR